MLPAAGRVAIRGDGRIHAPKDLIRRLEAADIARAGTALAAEHGREWRPTVPGNFVAGRLIGTTQLPSGRFVMIDDGLGFSLVFWRPALEQHVGDTTFRRRARGRRRSTGALDASEGSVSDLLPDKDRSRKYYRNSMAIRQSIDNLDDYLWTVPLEWCNQSIARRGRF